MAKTLPIQTVVVFGYGIAAGRFSDAAWDEDFVFADVTFEAPVKRFSEAARVRALEEARRVYGHLAHFREPVGPGRPVQMTRNGVEIGLIPLWDLAPEHRAQWDDSRKAYMPCAEPDSPGPSVPTGYDRRGASYD